MLIDPKPRRLAIGEQAHAIQACITHALDDLFCRAWKHVAPVACEFDGGRK
jgi:hypothetical protein